MTAELEAWRLAWWDALDEIRAARGMHWVTLSRFAGLDRSAWKPSRIEEGHWPGDLDVISTLLATLGIQPASFAAMVDRYVAIRTRASLAPHGNAERAA